MVAAEACERPENNRSGTDVGAFFIFSWATGWDTSVASPKKTGDHILNDHRGGDVVPTPVSFSELLHQQGGQLATLMAAIDFAISACTSGEIGAEPAEAAEAA